MELQNLFGFLDRFGVEVSGREAGQPDSGVLELLHRFAEGQCTAEERTEVCELLRANPAWLSWLAERVKGNRAAGEAQGM